MPGTSKIAISLPGELLEGVEKEREESGESRSQVIRRAIALLLRQRKEREMSEHYLQAYREMPEGNEEIESALRSASTILAGERWE